jgi:hypothetical protein
MFHRNTHKGRTWRILYRHLALQGLFESGVSLRGQPNLFADALIKQRRMQIEMSNALCAGRRCAKKLRKKKCLAMMTCSQSPDAPDSLYFRVNRRPIKTVSTSGIASLEEHRYRYHSEMQKRGNP